MEKTLRQPPRGFTLIELLLYISVASVMMLSLIFFVSILLQSRIKNQVIADIEQQGVRIVQLMGQSIRNAQGINSPTAGNSANSLSIDVVNAVTDPTLFERSGNIIQTKEGAANAIDLTSSKIIASGLSFQNLSKPGTQGIIRFQFTLTHMNPENKNEYNFSKTFYGSASLKNN